MSSRTRRPDRCVPADTSGRAGPLGEQGHVVGRVVRDAHRAGEGGVPDDEVAVADQRRLPVPAPRAGAQERVHQDTVAVAGLEGLQPVDGLDQALAPRPLEDDRAGVLAAGGGLEVAPADRAGPLAEEVDVGGVVHLIHEAGPADAAADLAEDDLAVGLPVPLHV
ncbi:MAG: hypothetical protein ACK559_07460, partial [bacterium]